MYNIDKTYGVPIEEISCPGCGEKYGHHNTTVDVTSGECSDCVKTIGYEYVELVNAEYYIKEVLGYSKNNF